MKSNTLKRKVFADTMKPVGGVALTPVDLFVLFHKSSLQQYEREHLQDMMENIRTYGVLPL